MSTTRPPSISWWSRNWKWCVPVAGALLLALLAAFVFGIIALVFGALRSSDPYQHALRQAQAHPGVIAALGEPVRPGWHVSGSISVDGASGEANLAIPLEGSRAEGTLYVVAEKHAGQWRYDTVAVTVDNGRIVLEGE